MSLLHSKWEKLVSDRLAGVMTQEDFGQLVEWIYKQWGIDACDRAGWDHPGALVADFAVLDSEAVWESAKALITHGPELAVWPPKPASLRAAALQRMREVERPALPVSTESYGWKAYSLKTYGEEISLREAVERTWAKAGKR